MGTAVADHVASARFVRKGWSQTAVTASVFKNTKTSKQVTSSSLLLPFWPAQRGSFASSFACHVESFIH
jgi:uncharacterized protein YjhX (UPF0386 family)